MRTLYVGGPCHVGKGKICHSLAETIGMVRPDLSVRLILDPAEIASRENGTTFDRVISRRVFVRAPDLWLQIAHRTIEIMGGERADSAEIVLMNESPLGFLGYLGYYGLLAGLTLKERNGIIQDLLAMGQVNEARHLFVQPWAGSDSGALAMNALMSPYASLGGARWKVLVPQADLQGTVKAGSRAGLGLLDVVPADEGVA